MMALATRRIDAISDAIRNFRKQSLYPYVLASVLEVFLSSHYRSPFLVKSTVIIKSDWMLEWNYKCKMFTENQSLDQRNQDCVEGKSLRP